MSRNGRILHTVLSVPVGEYVCTSAVRDHLAAIGHDVCVRTVQRDLLDCKDFGVIHDGTRRRWMRVRKLE